MSIRIVLLTLAAGLSLLAHSTDSHAACAVTQLQCPKTTELTLTLKSAKAGWTTAGLCGFKYTGKSPQLNIPAAKGALGEILQCYYSYICGGSGFTVNYAVPTGCTCKGSDGDYFTCKAN